ncbi:MAG: SCP2 sterol-binding domain-containing protein [Thiogranum sp.]
MTPATTLAAALETALDLYLKQDPQARQGCAALEGKIIGLDITGLGLSLYFLPGSHGIQVSSHYEGDVDTQLTGSPLGFARLALGSREDTLFKGAVEIKGDTETGQQFQDLLANTDWDWEEQLSHITGDVIARQIGNVARLSGKFINDSRNTLEQDVSEYLQEEARLLPTGSEVGNFLEDVDQLRADVDRLDARIARLLQTMDSEP